VTQPDVIVPDTCKYWLAMTILSLDDYRVCAVGCTYFDLVRNEFDNWAKRIPKDFKFTASF